MLELPSRHRAAMGQSWHLHVEGTLCDLRTGSWCCPSTQRSACSWLSPSANTEVGLGTNVSGASALLSRVLAFV